MTRPLRIALIAGEASGDLLGAGLITALREHYPHAEFEGVVGPEMLRAGCKALASIECLSVMGLRDVLRKLPEIYQLRRRLLAHFISHPPDLYIGIDAPDFNLSIEKKLKRRGIKTIHYVSPSIWAWRQNRVHKIAQSVDLMLILLPFEAKFYEDHQVPVRYVGHPLGDMIPLSPDKNSARQRLGLSKDKTIVALLPGSRASEIAYMGAAFINAAHLCWEKDPTIHFVVPMVNEHRRKQFETLQHTIISDVPITLIDGNSHTVLEASDAVLVTSGTATLEAMLFKRPMIVAYRLSSLSFWLGKRLVKVKYLALPNILTGEEIVPEYIQDKMTAENLAAGMLNIIRDKKSEMALVDRFTEIHHTLRQRSHQRAAEAIVELLSV